MLNTIFTAAASTLFPSLSPDYVPTETLLQQARAVAVARAIDAAFAQPSGAAQEILLAPRHTFTLQPLPAAK